ncbi:MAG: RNA methyltransferase [Firmicutes bacterium]|nr:RNA methyltransferase [Bacillota bacterium]
MIRLLSSLRQRKGRDATGLFLLEGRRAAEEALSHGNVRYLAYAPEALDEAKREQLGQQVMEALRVGRGPLQTVQGPLSLLASLTTLDTPPPVLAAAEWPWTLPGDPAGPLQEPGSGSALPELWVVLDEVQDPGNVGTIIRSAAAAGATGVLASVGSADPRSPKVVRATAGVLFQIPVYSRVDIVAWLQAARRRGLLLVASHPRGSVPYFRVDWTQPAALVVGNEGQGVRPAVMEQCVLRAVIPAVRPVESLNVGIAAAVILNEALRQRWSLPGMPES